VRLLVSAGVILVVVGLVIVVGAGDRMHEKMPVQVPPRGLAALPLVAGGALLTLAALLAILP